MHILNRRKACNSAIAHSAIKIVLDNAGDLHEPSHVPDLEPECTRHSLLVSLSLGNCSKDLGILSVEEPPTEGRWKGPR